MASRLGVGTYRMCVGVAEHESALVRALQAGIRVVDTSPAYSDGGSELLVAKCLADSGVDRRAVQVVSKFGYLQGGALEDHRSVPGGRWSRTIDFAPSSSHCLAPDFLLSQLEGSLERLAVSQLDCFLLHNPEHVLLDRIDASDTMSTDDPARPTSAVAAAMAELQLQVEDCFEALEAEVRRGRIRSYGISSNSFSVSPHDPHFLPHEWLLDTARRAATRVGNSAGHSFSTVELPINMLERTGLTGCARWARRHGLRVLASRPLTAFHESGTFRLVDNPSVDAISEFDRSRDETLQHFTPPSSVPGQQPSPAEEETMEACALLRDLVVQLGQQLHAFGSVAEYEAALAQSVVPVLNEQFDGMDDESAEQLDRFFRALGHAVRMQCAHRARQVIVQSGEHVELQEAVALQTQALRWLGQQSDVDTILVGLPREELVEQTISAIEID